MRYSDFYKKYGNRKLSNLVEPVLLKSEMFEFPKSSILQWYIPSDVVTPPNKGYGYLNKAIIPAVVTITEYTGNQKGSSTHKSISPTTAVSELSQKEPNFKFLKPTAKNLKINNKKLLIFSYGSLNNFYRYSPDPLNEYNKWYNSFQTMVGYATNAKVGSSRHKFILIDLPPALPSRMILDKYINAVTNQTLTYLPTYKYFNVLEIWKLLTPGVDSLLKAIPDNELENVTLMFNANGKISFLNMKTFLSTVDEYAIKTKLSTKPASTIRKMFYIFMNKLLINTDNKVTDNAEMSDLNVTVTSHAMELEDNNEEEVREVSISAELEAIPESSEPVGIDTDEDIDSLLTSKDIETNSVLDSDVFETVDSILTYVPEQQDVIQAKLDSLKVNKVITPAKAKSMQAIIDKQKNMKVVIPDIGSIALEELLVITEDDLTLDKNLISLPTNKVVLDKTMEKDTTGVLEEQYLKKVYRKDLTSTLFSVQNEGMLVSDYEINKEENILGGFEEHVISIATLDGNTSKIKLKLPVIDDNGEFMMSGNTYRMRKQKTDIPIRKLLHNKVALTSYYGKSFVTKATHKKDDAGFWFRKQLIANYETDSKLKNLVLVEVKNIGVGLPLMYSTISRYVKSFKYGPIIYHFEHSTRMAIFKKGTDTSKFEKKGTVVVGVTTGNRPIVMNFSGDIWDGDTKLDNIHDQLGIDDSKMPIEYSVIKVYKQYIPTVVMLSYYLGLTQLLKLLKTKYDVVEPNERIKITEEQYVVKFKDKKLIINKDNGLSDMIIAGLVSMAKVTKTIDYSIMDSKNNFVILFSALQLPTLYINEIKLLESMFIDPITKTILTEMKMPVNYPALLIQASKLLVNDNYNNPNDISGMVIKGYERVSGMVYKELVKSIKEHKNKSIFGKSKLTVNPYAVWGAINDDSTTVPVDDLNPIAMIKQSDDVSMLGAFGRSKETFSRDTRVMHPSEIGIMSEATKDSSDVGITAYMSAAPKLESLRGVTGKIDFKEDGLTSVLSTTGLLMYGSTQDDPKRTNFANIQASHIIPIAHAKAPGVRTGYEAIIAMRAGEKFATVAEMDGRVMDVSKKVIRVEYVDKTGSSKVVKIPLKEWTTKEEAGSCYTHTIVANMVKGEKFVAGDTIAYDSLFFEPDIFNKKRVIYKSSTDLNVVLMEDIQTFEDSCAISGSVAKKLETITTKVKSIIVDSTDEIINMVKVGDKVEPSTPMFSITDPSIMKIKGLDEEAIATLQKIKGATPKAKVRGTISKIVIYYNSELDGLSGTLGELVKVSDKNLVEAHGKKTHTGKVDTTYSVDGNRLQEGQVEIKIYINVPVGMGVGDKAIFANQLKTTVGEVFHHTMETAGDKTKIEAIFSTKSIAARIVTSPMVIGTTNTVLERLAKKAVDIYFGK